MSCVRCSKTHSTVQAFLINCRDCNRKWHHRCHIPPISDQELVARIKAHNAEDQEKGLQGWRCKRCSKRRNGNVSDTLSTPGPSTRSPTLRSASIPSPDVVHPPLTSEPRSFKRTAHPLAREEEESSDGSSRLTSHVGPFSKSASPSKPVKTLAQEEEESSDSSVQVTSHTEGTSIRATPLLASSSSSRKVGFQRPMHTEDEPHVISIPSDDDTSVPPSRPRKKMATGDGLRTHSNSPAPVPSRQRDREAYMEKHTEGESRRRKKSVLAGRSHTQPSNILDAQDQENVEQITPTVIDLTLTPKGGDSRAPSDSTQQRSTMPIPVEQLPTALTSAAHHVPDPTLPSIDQQGSPPVTDKHSDAKPTLIPHWLREQPHTNDIWERAAASRRRTSSRPCPPTIAQRKVKAKARKLGDVQPPLHQFILERWLNEKKDPRPTHI